MKREPASHSGTGAFVHEGEAEATVLFADLRGFTALAEVRPPVDVLRLVNRCAGVMMRAVQFEAGVVNTFLGDGIMAVFGLSEVGDSSATDHAMKAVRAARAMQSEMSSLAPLLREEGWESVGLGVGLETGRVVAGHVGVPERREYTVLGDIVNVASRLTAGAAAGEVVLGAGAAHALADLEAMIFLGSISIRGRRQPVDAWRLA